MPSLRSVQFRRRTWGAAACNFYNRYYGFCHPAAKKTRLKITALSGKPIHLGATSTTPLTTAHSVYLCPCCQKIMPRTGKLPPAWSRRIPTPARAPPATSTAR